MCEEKTTQKMTVLCKRIANYVQNHCNGSYQQMASLQKNTEINLTKIPDLAIEEEGYLPLKRRQVEDEYTNRLFSELQQAGIDVRLGKNSYNISQWQVKLSS